MRSLIAAGVFLTMSLGLVMADQFTGTIKKIDGNKLTISKKSKKDPDAGEVTLPVAANVKVTKGKFNKDAGKIEAGDPLEGGLKNEAIKVDAKATFITDADNKNITGIIIGFGGFNKKKKAE
jgi:transcription antitermination factor NusG